MSGRRMVRDIVRRTGRIGAGLLLACAAVLPPLAAPAHAADFVASSTAGVQANDDDELVYLDADGVIMVLDPTVAEGEPKIVWQSPTGGWTYIALGDFNADGDAEIAAVGNVGTNRVAIFDPVAEGLEPGEADGQINGVLWKKLFEETLPGAPLLVATGNFDLDAPADELVYYYTLPPDQRPQEDDPYRFVFLSAEGEVPDGTTWSEMFTYDSGNAWTWLGAGNLNGTGADEVALIDSEVGNLSIYTILNGTLERLLRHSNLEKAWQDGAIGQYRAGGDEELAVGRETVYDLPALIVLQYAGGSWSDAFAEYFDPPPEAVFMGDLTGNGDDEVIVLRVVPSEVSGRPRLFVRDNGNDNIGLGELSLDADNGYRAGVAGDVDGDGRDEIIVMRENRIRIFTEPENSSAVVDEPATTGSRLVVAGNLDANGLAGASRFGASPDSVTDAIVSGSVGSQQSVALSDVVNGNNVPFSYDTENNSSWLQVSRTSSTTPSTLQVTLDATTLISGTFTDTIVINTSDTSVLNSPFGIDVTLTVKPGISVSPSSIVDLEEDCESSTAISTYILDVQGTEGADFELSTSTPAPWLNYTPVSDTVPAQVTLTLSSGLVTAGFGATDLVVRAEIGGEVAVASTDVTLLCIESPVRLPLVMK